jgi:hypothetical protein
LIINSKTVAKIHMRHIRTTYDCSVEIGHDQVDGELPSLAPELPAGFVAELIAAAGALASGVPGLNIWSGVSLP